MEVEKLMRRSTVTHALGFCKRLIAVSTVKNVLGGFDIARLGAILTQERMWAMNIEIHQPELEALILQRMASGRFQNVEDLLRQSLEASPEVPEQPTSKPKQNLTQFLKESPLWGSGLTIERSKDVPRRIEF